MRAVLLTTDTTHHAWFAWKLGERFPLHAVLLETKTATFPFPTAHPFERERETHERASLLEGFKGGLGELIPCRTFASVNDPDAVAEVERLRPDVVLLFGVGRVKPELLRVPARWLNLHGGDPEEYRGLDSHLWAIYHRDFAGLVTTLHWVAPGLDTGDLVERRALEIPASTRLLELRAINTRVALELASSALARIARGEEPERTRQQKAGRYYSAMPAVLKDLCVTRFERFTAP